MVRGRGCKSKRSSDVGLGYSEYSMDICDTQRRCSLTQCYGTLREMEIILTKKESGRECWRRTIGAGEQGSLG